MSFFFFFKKKTAYEVRISDWSSDVCSSDLAWLTLFDDADAYCPTGRQLKAWLFGGDEIGTDKALFDLGDYKGQIVSDLFGKEQYFADSDAFWAAQNVVIEARCEDYLDAGWPDVFIVPRGDYFSAWEDGKANRKKGEIGRAAGRERV